MRTAWRRLVAWLIDCLAILVWVGVVAAVGVPLYLAGAIRMVDPLALNLVSAALVVVPATVLMAALEAGSRHATFGKRIMRLRLTAAGDDAPPRLPRTLLRNTLKIALPWLIGHAAVFSLVQSEGRGTLALVLLLAAYVLPVLYLVTLFLPTHRTAYDRVCRTAVSATGAH